jgi:ribose transport system substrate-binding protein
MGAGVAGAETKMTEVDLAPTKVGPKSEMLAITKFCGTKPIKVAYADGFGGNTWRKIARGIFEAEAAKCKNITAVAYTDGEFNPEKQISNFQSLTAQGYDVIVTFPDAGEALIHAMHEATQAGIAVVPYATGVVFPGKRGQDYLTLVTNDHESDAAELAQWEADQMKGHGNVIVYGGTPGNTLTTAEQKGWKKVFDKYPGIKVLEGPVVTNWDPAEYTKVTTGMLAKYTKIDAIFADYGHGVMGALRAFQAAGRPIPLVVAQDANELGCFWQENHAANPGFQLATLSYSAPWMAGWALRKGVAAVEGIPDTEPSILKQTINEDSTNPAKLPKCDKSLPPDAMVSISDISKEQLIKLLNK